MAEIIAVLFFTKSGMRYNPKDPKVRRIPSYVELW